MGGNASNEVQQKIEYRYGRYVGQVKNGKRDGHGKMSWKSGPPKGAHYLGQWKNDHPHGQGEYFWDRGGAFERRVGKG